MSWVWGPQRLDIVISIVTMVLVYAVWGRRCVGSYPIRFEDVRVPVGRFVTTDRGRGAPIESGGAPILSEARSAVGSGEPSAGAGSRTMYDGQDAM